mmetsp:Transcript_22819/g.40109  ORF Transcript_22819/g.40109 Transcript_22819/m.40109 type:complete len:130 (+) Transcript_22819:19-408(+)
MVFQCKLVFLIQLTISQSFPVFLSHINASVVTIHPRPGGRLGVGRVGLVWRKSGDWELAVALAVHRVPPTARCWLCAYRQNSECRISYGQDIQFQFDTICLILDSPNVTNDRMLAQHLVGLYYETRFVC